MIDEWSILVPAIAPLISLAIDYYPVALAYAKFQLYGEVAADMVVDEAANSSAESNSRDSSVKRKTINFQKADDGAKHAPGRFQARSISRNCAYDALTHMSN